MKKIVKNKKGVYVCVDDGILASLARYVAREISEFFKRTKLSRARNSKTFSVKIYKKF